MAGDAPVLSSVVLVLSADVADELLAVLPWLASRMLRMSCAARVLPDPVIDSDTALPSLRLSDRGNLSHNAEDEVNFAL